MVDAAEQRLCGSPSVPVFLGFHGGLWRANILKIVEIVTNCAGPCPEMANMEEMPGVAPYGLARVLRNSLCRMQELTDCRRHGFWKQPFTGVT
ncbi:hypothetical protein QO058_18530 [Bosea vestrisii]|uniref:hypothetical protein n=1 Tax=Bosea vestrisii TaxID=151416 RepID=UPI0024E0035F|nr:hypothetical protein [Bosea vestrisii]WID94812.1 hypothetical protein QO058_18530 [Bosea vestrisii]